MNSQRPSAANPSISSSASAWNDGTMAAISRDEKAGFISRRSRAWSSPSRFRMHRIHQSAHGPVTSLWAGHAALPCTSRRSLISRLTGS